MYKAYFGFARNPFEVTPDPAFLFRTARQNEALAAVYYGIVRSKGFVVLTGEVGTGKTLALRCVARMLRPADVAFAFIFNPLLTPLQFLQYIVSDLGMQSCASKEELLHVLNSFLIARYQKGLTTALMVDEAQLLTGDVLEEIRLLTNLETERKLLQIVLAGQPELENVLDSPQLRQVKQRIALRCTLQPFDRAETASYIRHRIEVAGAQNTSSEIFPEATVDLIYRYSGGIPRLINTICENALMSAYASQTPFVAPEIVSEVASDFRLGHEAPLQAPNPAALDSLVEFLESLKKSPALRDRDDDRRRIV